MAGFRLAVMSRQSGARLQRARSEGRLDEAGLKHPAMGVNGLLIEQPRRIIPSNVPTRRQLFASQPSLVAAAPLLRLPEPIYVRRRPASAAARPVDEADDETDEEPRRNGRQLDSVQNYSVVMRPKKSSIASTQSSSNGPTSVQSNSSTSSSSAAAAPPPPLVAPIAAKPMQHFKSAKSTVAPMPPNNELNGNGNYALVQKNGRRLSPQPANPLNGNRFRPLSLTSSGSGSCSSGMGEVRWRDSTARLSASNSPPDSARQYAEEHQPQVAKHERLLDEEAEVIQRGVDVSRQLIHWYEERAESIQKRRRMLNKGMVALDSAVHEQKLNFHRAQITELNRRMTALMGTTKRGFPTHENMIPNGAPAPVAVAAAVESNYATAPQSNGSSNGPIRSAIPPPVAATAAALRQQNQNRSAENANYLVNQNRKLADELDARDQMIERLQREKRFAEMRQQQQQLIHHRLDNPKEHRIIPQKQKRPSAYVRPAVATVPNYVQMPIRVHDTLL